MLQRHIDVNLLRLTSWPGFSAHRVADRQGPGASYAALDYGVCSCGQRSTTPHTCKPMHVRSMHKLQRQRFYCAERKGVASNQDLAVMEGVLPAADMQRWVAARSKPKYAALQMTQLIRKAQVHNAAADHVCTCFSLQVLTACTPLTLHHCPDGRAMSSSILSSGRTLAC